MRETPDYEEIYGIDPNDAANFESKGSAMPTVAAPEANHWLVVGRVGDDPKQKVMALRVADEGMYWFRPSGKGSTPRDAFTMFTDLGEARQTLAAAKELFPELTIWVKALAL